MAIFSLNMSNDHGHMFPPFFKENWCVKENPPRVLKVGGRLNDSRRSFRRSVCEWFWKRSIWVVFPYAGPSTLSPLERSFDSLLTCPVLVQTFWVQLGLSGCFCLYQGSGDRSKIAYLYFIRVFMNRSSSSRIFED